MLRFIALGIAAALCVGAFPLHVEEPKDGELKSKVNALEAEVAVLKRALGYFQARFQTERDRISDVNNMRNLASLLTLSSRKGPKLGADGRIDVYHFVRSEEIAEEHFSIFTSHRCGIRPTNAEIKAGDYTHFPFGRYKGAATTKVPMTPWLWERYPHPDGTRLVGYSSGAAKLIPEAEFQALMKKHGQDP